MQIEIVEIEKLIPYARNSRTHSDEQVAQIAASIKEFGFTNPVLIDGDGGIIAGHGRVMAARKLGMDTVPTIMLAHLSDTQKKAYIIADNKLALNAGWDEAMLALEMEDLRSAGYELGLTGFDQGEIDEFLADEGQEHEEDATVLLSERFGVPPFSIFDTRQGYWQDRKRMWMKMIGDNGESREETLFAAGTTEFQQKIADVGTVSILDPVMAEMVTRWFSPKNGKCFDTFAGDTVYGYVAGMLGREFTGIELRGEQVSLNNERANKAGIAAKYIKDDGRNVLKHIERASQDFFFSCPPYFDLEVYSDDPLDASNQSSYKDFLEIIDSALSDAIKALKPNRFACIVMSNVRDRRGFYQDICGDIMDIMTRGGMHLYNEIVLVNVVGTASVRAGNYMRKRKVARVHQDIMVFFKGEQFGDEILEENGFDLMERAASIRLHEDIMIFFKGDPQAVPKDFGDVDKFLLGGEQEMGDAA